MTTALPESPSSQQTHETEIINLSSERLTPQQTASLLQKQILELNDQILHCGNDDIQTSRKLMQLEVQLTQLIKVHGLDEIIVKTDAAEQLRLETRQLAVDAYKELHRQKKATSNREKNLFNFDVALHYQRIIDKASRFGTAALEIEDQAKQEYIIKRNEVIVDLARLFQQIKILESQLPNFSPEYDPTGVLRQTNLLQTQDLKVQIETTRATWSITVQEIKSVSQNISKQ